MSAGEGQGEIERLLAESGWLARLARALVQDAARRDDVVQEVWLAALRNPPERGRERGWLRSVLRRRAAELGRERRAASDEVDGLADAGAEESCEAAATLESHARLGEALRELPEPYRAVVVARFFRDEAPRDIARRLGRKDATVRSQLSRGLDLLRSTLERKDPRAWALGLVPLALGAPEFGAATAAGGSGGAATTLWSTQVAKITGVVMSQKIIIGVTGLAVGVGLWLLAGTLNEEEAGLEPDRGSRAEAPAIAEAEARRGTAERAVGTRKPEIRDPVDAPPTSPPGLRLRVRSEADAPIASARVVLDDGAVVVATAMTDKHGEIETPGRGGPLFATVLAPGRPSFRGAIAGRGEEEIVLPAGAVLSGRVVVRGGLPYRPLALSVRQSIAVLRTIPEPVWKKLWPVATNSGLTTVAVEADGSFRFEGLPADMPCSVQVSAGFAFEGADGKLGISRGIERPVEGLNLEVLALPRITGRLVDEETGAGLPAHPVKVRHRTPTRGRSTAGGYSDDEGYFVIGLRALEFSEVVVEIPRPGLSILRQIEAPFRDTRDLGVIPVAAPLPWSIRVADPDGVPVAGARVALEDGDLEPATDPSGRARIPDLPRVHQEVLVGAPGFRTRRVVVERSDDGAQDIVLHPANTLTVRVGALPAGVTVRTVAVSGPPDLLSRDFSFDLHAAAADRPSFSLGRSRDAVTFEFQADRGGRFVLEDLRPGIPFTVRLLDPRDQIVAERAEAGLGAEERREVTVDHDPGQITPVELEIRDAEGRLLGDLRITRLEEAKKESEWTIEEPEVLTLLLDRRAREAVWLVEKEGYRSARVEARTLAGGRHALTLERKPD